MSAPSLHPARPVDARDAAGEAPSLAVSVVESEEALGALEGAWRTCLRPGRFFVGPEWTRTWLARAGPRARPFVLVARDPSGAVAGLLPLARARGGIEPCGAREGVAHVDVVAVPGLEPAVAAAMVAMLRGLRGVRVRLSRLAGDGALFVEATRGDLVPAPVRAVVTTCPYVRVGGGWEAFLGGLAKHARHEARRRLARAFARPGVRVRWVERPEDCAAAVGVLFDLHARRFAGMRRETAFRGRNLQDFHVALAQAAARSGRLLLGVLEEAGRPVAAAYGFRDAEVVQLFQTGVDPEALGWGAGVALRAALVRDRVAGAGLRELDLLDGCSDWKARWASGVRVLHDVELFPAGPSGAARRLVAASMRAARTRLSRWRHGERCPGRSDPCRCALPGCPAPRGSAGGDPDGQESSEVHSS